MMKPLLVATVICALAAPATAQEFTPPPFDALQQQRRAVEQQRLDSNEKARIADQQRNLADAARNAAKPGAVLPPSPAIAAQRQMEFRDTENAIRLQGDLDRMAQTNERLIATSQLPNRRIARSSILVVSNPAAYALPPAPRGKYYARIDGRFVLVDAMSELAEQFVDAPAEPRGDAPLEPAPRPLPPAPVGP